MKKNRKLKVLFVVLFVALVVLVSNHEIKERQEFLHKKNTYTVDYLEIKLHKRVSIDDNILEYLPKAVSETNLFGEKRAIDFDYEINGEIKELHGNERFFDYAINDEENYLENSKLVIALVNKEKAYRQEIKFEITYEGIKLMPLVLNDEIVVDNVNLILMSTRNDFLGEIPLSTTLKKAVVTFIDSEKLIDDCFIKQKKINLVNESFLELSDEQIIEKIFDDTWDNVDSRWVDYLKAEFLKIPYELKEFAYHEGLIIRVEDFSNTITQADIDIDNAYYGEMGTINSYVNEVIANYSNLEPKIEFNTSHQCSILNKRYTKEFLNPNNLYEMQSLKDYERYVYGVKSIELNTTERKMYYLKTEFIETLHHEFGHFLHDRSNYVLNFTDDELVTLTNKYEYNYDNLHDFEVIAHGFSMYFYDKDYLMNTFPVMQREIDGVLDNIKCKDKILAMEIIQSNKEVLEKIKSRNVASKTETQTRLDAIQ